MHACLHVHKFLLSSVELIPLFDQVKPFIHQTILLVNRWGGREEHKSKSDHVLHTINGTSRWAVQRSYVYPSHIQTSQSIGMHCISDVLDAAEAHSCTNDSLTSNFLSKAQLLLKSIVGCFDLKVFVSTAYRMGKL